MGQLTVDLTSKLRDSKKSLPVDLRQGVSFPRHFTAKLEAGKSPYDDVQWELRAATIGNDKGAVIFEQRDVEVPADWSQTATNIVVSKYFSSFFWCWLKIGVTKQSEKIFHFS